MQKRHYKTVLYFISLVILLTLIIQVYWNYKNYQQGKQQLINEVQISLDQAVDTYYIDLATDNTIGFAINQSPNFKFLQSYKGLSTAIDINISGWSGDSLNMLEHPLKSSHQINDSAVFETMRFIIQDTAVRLPHEKKEFLDPNDPGAIGSVPLLGGGTAMIDTLVTQLSINDSIKRGAVKWFLGDSTQRDNALAQLTSRVIFSISSDSLALDKMSNLVAQELSRKQIDVDYGIEFVDPSGQKQYSNKKISDTAPLTTASTSAYLPSKSRLTLAFTNGTMTILKNNLLGIFLSFILMAAVVSSLLYLLYIIKQQKELAAIKNDFIGNMTHEFKTPIATIGVALESIQHFNTNNDPEKTKKYIDMSSAQIAKLNTMVEKLLETATLDKEALALQKEPQNIVSLLESIKQKYTQTYPSHHISLYTPQASCMLAIDVFHLENALDNIFDNAIKYGGDRIEISLHPKKDSCLLVIKDNGHQLTKAQATKIFEKFYRVPQGNTHDVKGFGIGLFYTKTIIEKHGGQILCTTAPTTFNIHLPYV